MNTTSTTSIFDEITITQPLAPRITIYGKPGIGKSTLAAQFPKPLFLLTEENGLAGLPAIRIKDYRHIMSVVKELVAAESIPYETVVIDSVSKLDAMVVQYTLLQSSAQSSGKGGGSLVSAFGGYGAGFERAAGYHRELKKLLDALQRKGIAVIFVAHTEVKKHKSPEYEDYDTITITMNHDKSRVVYVDDVDAVLYCRLQSEVVENESGRSIIKSSDVRIISTTLNDAYVTKNRFPGLPKLVLLDENSFKKLRMFIPFYSQEQNQEEA